MAVFLSYAREDRERVDVLRQDLDNLGGPVWFDARLTGGQDWWDEILRQIRTCDLLVLAVSARSLRSEACRAEVRYGLALDRAFVGVRLDDTELVGMDEAVRRTQLVDFTTRDVESVKLLARAVLAAGGPRPLPDVRPEPPPMPLSYADRFAEVFGPQLNLDQQLALFARLRFDIEGESNVTEARELLTRLYERPDLSWRVRQDIEAFRGPDSPRLDEAVARPAAAQIEPVPQRSRVLFSATRERDLELETRRGVVRLRFTYLPLPDWRGTFISVQLDGREAFLERSWRGKIDLRHRVGDGECRIVIAFGLARSRQREIVTFAVTVNGELLYRE